MNKYEYCEFISNIAIKSILYEVSASPKPGLVDRYNSGAHRDMDFFTFLSSTSVLSHYIYKCTKAGMEYGGHDYKQLLRDIRPIGIKAEQDMFKATSGINTHKGMIFSFGVIAAAAGSLYRENKLFNQYSIDISNRVKQITEGITKELEHIDEKTKLTYGEKLYKKYRVKGIRGEAETGFETVMDYSLPIFSELLQDKDYHINHILIQSLLKLIANTEDGNILGRHDMDILYYSQEQGKKALALGGIFTGEGKDFIYEMDKDFIDKNISPGGAADLLAITMLIYMIENGDCI